MSATAAFGSVNGYSKYKEAVKALALETDNFTANGTLKMICDGKEVVHVTEDYAMDGHNMSSHSISKDSMGSHEQYETILNGVNTWFDVNDRYYYQSEYETDSSSLGGNLLGVDQDDEMARRMVNFMEIAADTVVGELKNNFVQVGKEDGATLYQVEIAKNQVPSLVNAGLSLFAYSVGQSHDYDYTVNYEDYSATAIQNYEKVTGETLPETFKEGYINGGRTTRSCSRKWRRSMRRTGKKSITRSWRRTTAALSTSRRTAPMTTMPITTPLPRQSRSWWRITWSPISART